MHIVDAGFNGGSDSLEKNWKKSGDGEATIAKEPVQQSNAETEWKSIHDTGTDRLKGRSAVCGFSWY